MSGYNIFAPIILYDNIKIHSNQLTSNIDNLLLSKLNAKYSGKCHKYGFIKNNSIKILEIMKGQIEAFSFQGFIIYQIKFTADICKLPNSLNIIGKVINKNDFALLCNFSYFDETSNDNITLIEIIIPFSTSEKISSLINLTTINIDDKVQIEIIGNKFSIGDTKISALGRIIKKVNNESEMIFINNDEEDEMQNNDEEDMHNEELQNDSDDNDESDNDEVTDTDSNEDSSNEDSDDNSDNEEDEEDDEKEDNKDDELSIQSSNEDSDDENQEDELSDENSLSDSDSDSDSDVSQEVKTTIKKKVIHKKPKK